MLNPATMPRDELNSFTAKIVNNQNLGVFTPVRMRNGDTVFPIWKPAESEHEENCFVTDPHVYCWNPDGTSVTRPSLDMMEIVDL